MGFSTPKRFFKKYSILNLRNEYLAGKSGILSLETILPQQSDYLFIANDNSFLEQIYQESQLLYRNKIWFLVLIKLKTLISTCRR